MKYILYYCFFWFLPFLVGGCGEDDSSENNGDDISTNYFSGVWITSSASEVLESRDNIKKAVSKCKEYGINHLFVVVWNNGKTLYPSKVMEDSFGLLINEKYEGRDPLQELIEEAHCYNLKVHAWFEYGFAASYGQNGGKILAERPQWAARDKQGNLVIKNGFVWMNALHPEVQDFMLSLVREVMLNYDVDGIQGDDRLPAMPSHGGYDDYTMELYRNEHNGSEPPLNETESEWVRWRCDKLSRFMGRLYKEVKDFNSKLIVSSAPSIYPWGKQEYLQDWPTWLEKGYVDLVIPQHYRYDIDAYQSLLNQQLSFVKPKDRKKFMPGILIQNGTFNPTEDLLKKMIECNRRNNLNNECFWFYEGLNKFPSFFMGYRNN